MQDNEPDRQWTLSSPATIILLWGPETNDTWAIKMTLIELFVRGDLILTTEFEVRRFRRERSVVRVTRGSEQEGIRAPALQAAMDCLPTLGGVLSHGPSMSLQELAQALFKRQLTQERVRGRKRWRPSGPGFVQSEVLPELFAADLIIDTGNRQFGLAWRLPEEGEEALVALGRVLTFAHEGLIPMISTDPEQAFRFVERYGTALLLARGLPEALRRLASWAETARLADQPQSVSPARGSPPIGTSHLAGHFGPYNVDQLFHVVGSEVDLAWSDLRRGSLFMVGGE